MNNIEFVEILEQMNLLEIIDIQKGVETTRMKK